MQISLDPAPLGTVQPDVPGQVFPEPEHKQPKTGFALILLRIILKCFPGFSSVCSGRGWGRAIASESETGPRQALGKLTTQATEEQRPNVQCVYAGACNEVEKKKGQGDSCGR